jgi:mono/diheme cytochrome c family protein
LVMPLCALVLFACLACIAIAEDDPFEQASTPSELLARQAAKGTLTNPYAPPSSAAANGNAAYLKAGCQGCHGADGSRGPSLKNDRWIYGFDDDTLFRLIALGSDGLRRQGYHSSSRENVAGPMPAQGYLLAPDEIWAVIAWLRTVQEKN